VSIEFCPRSAWLSHRHWVMVPAGLGALEGSEYVGMSWARSVSQQQIPGRGSGEALGTAV